MFAAQTIFLVSKKIYPQKYFKITDSRYWSNIFLLKLYLKNKSKSIHQFEIMHMCVVPPKGLNTIMQKSN